MLRNEDPHGTLDELSALRVDLARIGCCHKKVVEDGQLMVWGCREFKRCTLPEKVGKGPATSGLNGRGPCNKGLQTLKKMPDGSTKATRTVLSCVDIPGFVARIEAGGGIVEIVASEGEEIMLRGSRVKDETIPGQGLVRIHEDGIYPEKVKAFPRPGSGYNLPEQKMIAEFTKEVLDRRRAEAPSRLLGIEESDG
jgi:hypothetical protein